MAKVRLLQTTDMRASGLLSEGLSDTNVFTVELDVIALSVKMTCLGSFDIQGDPSGIINQVSIDTNDLGQYPNFEITQLSYQLTPAIYESYLKFLPDFYRFTGLLLQGADTVLGSAGDDVILSWDGNDVIDGGAGADTMRGGLGNDTYYVDNPGDKVQELVGEGTDTVYTKVNFLIEPGSSIQYLRANAGATGLSLAGNELANTIIGGAGQDNLIGGAGADVLNGGGGADGMIGGLDNDTYFVDNPGDLVTENVGEGTDTVYTKINFTISPGNSIQILRANAGSAALVLTGNELANTIVGGTGNDVLNGGAGNDVLNGGAGADVMAGGLGNDTYYVDNVGDKVTELVGEGTNTVIAAINYAIAPGSSIQFLTAGGTGGLTLVGNELANTIKGSLGSDTLTGGSGSDVLIGAAGSDMLTGGTGADTFRFAAVADSTTIIGARDTVLDFSSAAGDKIDLHLIDANTTVAGDQAFAFIGLNAFTGKLGEVRFAPSGADALISADLTGDKQADFSVLVSGAHTFSGVDFLL